MFLRPDEAVKLDDGLALAVDVGVSGGEGGAVLMKRWPCNWRLMATSFSHEVSNAPSRNVRCLSARHASRDFGERPGRLRRLRGLRPPTRVRDAAFLGSADSIR